MKESKIEIHERKIRNGLRKQADKIQREKEKVWDKLKEVDTGGRIIDIEIVKQAVTANARKLNARWTWDRDELVKLIDESDDG